MQRTLDQPVPDPSVRVPVVVDLLKETEVDEYINFRPNANPSEIRSLLTRGDRCFVARHEGQVVHACWATTSYAWIDYLARRIQLAPDEAYTYDIFTLPAFRGQNIVSTVMSVHVIPYFRGAGFRRMITSVLPENKASIRGLRKAGYQPFGVMGCVKLGPWRRDFFRLI